MRLKLVDHLYGNSWTRFEIFWTTNRRRLCAKKWSRCCTKVVEPIGLYDFCSCTILVQTFVQGLYIDCTGIVTDLYKIVRKFYSKLVQSLYKPSTNFAQGFYKDRTRIVPDLYMICTRIVPDLVHTAVLASYTCWASLPASGWLAGTARSLLHL